MHVWPRQPWLAWFRSPQKVRRRYYCPKTFAVRAGDGEPPEPARMLWLWHVAEDHTFATAGRIHGLAKRWHDWWGADLPRASAAYASARRAGNTLPVSSPYQISAPSS